MASALRAALARSGAALDDDRARALRAEVVARGELLLPRVSSFPGSPLEIEWEEVARSIELPPQSLARVFGFGYEQADALARVAGSLPSLRGEVARLGALFNLGISLFDCLCDRFPARGASLVTRINPRSLAASLNGHSIGDTAGSDPAIEGLVRLFDGLLQGARQVALQTGRAAALPPLLGLLEAMYQSERFTLDHRRDTTPPTRAVLRALRAKSVLPFVAMGHLAALARPLDDGDEPPVLRRAATWAGEALWITDDLVDLDDDHASGAWSRPLWMTARTTGLDGPSSLAPALLERDAARLASCLARLGSLPAPGAARLATVVALAVAGWIAAIED